MKLTKEKLEALISDEEQAEHEYIALGFFQIARDEGKHAKILKDIYKKRYG